MPETLAPEPTHVEAARLFRYVEPCPRCGKATKYGILKRDRLNAANSLAVVLEFDRFVELQCTACDWREVRC